MVQGALLEDLNGLDPHLDAWDGLAVATGQPYCAPGWMIAWWREAAPADARLRVAVATEDGRLVGIAPFYAQRRLRGLEWLRTLASPVSHRTQPLAEHGREEAAAGALARALAGARPRPAVLAFDGVADDSPWPDLLAAAWPGGAPRLHREQEVPAPVLDLGGGDYESWLAGKSSNFRQQVRRLRRQLESGGAVFRRVGEREEIERDLPAFARLHHARWDPRGGSEALGESVEAMLRAATRELAPRGRLWLWSIDVADEPVSSHLFVGAGAEVIYWLGGFDDAWAGQKPGLQALVAAVEDGFARGDRRLDLGPGGQDYKYRLADREETLVFVTLAPRGLRYPVTRALLAAHELRRSAGQRLSPERRARLGRLLRRGS